VDIRMFERWNSDTNQPTGLTVPGGGAYRRLSYVAQTSLYYRLYANEYWFFLVPADNTGNYSSSLQAHGSSAGVGLPPIGIPTAPTYKAIFVLSAYNTSGQAETGNAGNFINSSISTSGNYYFLSPVNGSVVRINFLNTAYPRAYTPHTDAPAVLVPFAYFPDSTNNNVLAVLPYAAIIQTANLKTPFTTFTTGGETWVALINGAAGEMFARIA